MPCAGFGMGDVTMRDFLEVRGLLPKYNPSADVMICILEDDYALLNYSEDVAKDLRSQKINVDINYSFKSLGDQIKSATKKQIPYAIVIGKDEAETKTYKIKDLSTEEEVNKIVKTQN